MNLNYGQKFALLKLVVCGDLVIKMAGVTEEQWAVFVAGGFNYQLAPVASSPVRAINTAWREVFVLCVPQPLYVGCGETITIQWNGHGWVLLQGSVLYGASGFSEFVERWKKGLAVLKVKAT